MKQKTSLFLLIYLLFLTACSEDTTKEDNSKIIKTTLAKEENKKNILIVPQEAHQKKEKNFIKKEPNTAPTTVIKPIIQEHEFIFEDLNQHSTILNVKNNLYNFNNIQQPIVMINLFATWCPPCRGELPHLNNLQKKFKKNLFILSALVHDQIKNDKLSKFLSAEKLHLFVSIKQKEHLKFTKLITPKLGLNADFPLPLMIIFVRGKYFTHYEGLMPEEMIESDLKLLLKKIQK